MSKESLKQQMRELQIRAVSIDHQQQALRKLYDAALMVNNNTLAEGYRTQMHDLLDVQLDTASSIAQVTRSIIDLL